jgi:hypothetical protein
VGIDIDLNVSDIIGQHKNGIIQEKKSQDSYRESPGGQRMNGLVLERTPRTHLETILFVYWKRFQNVPGNLPGNKNFKEKEILRTR